MGRPVSSYNDTEVAYYDNNLCLGSFVWFITGTASCDGPPRADIRENNSGSRLSLNPYPSVDSTGYGLSGVIGYECSVLVQNDDSVDPKSMGGNKSMDYLNYGL